MFTASDPAYDDKVRDSFARQPFMTTMGATLLRVEPGDVEIVLPFDAKLTQQHGFFHGGVTSAIADAAGGYAAFSLFPANSTVLTVEYKMNLLSPARGERLRAIGRVVKHGRTLTFCNLEVFADRDGTSTLCANGQQTLICLHDRPDRAA